MKQMECDIIRDLFPSYIENLTSERSNQAIAKHILDCPECKKYLQELQQNIVPQTVPSDEIDYLKKIRHKMKKSTYISLGILAFVLVGALGVLAKFFIVGRPANMFSTDLTIAYDYNDNNVIIKGQLLNGNRVSRVRVNGEYSEKPTQLTVYEVLPSFLFDKKDFTVTIPLQDDLYVVWQEKNNQQDLFWESMFLPYVSVREKNVYTKNGLVADRTVYAKLMDLFDSAKNTGTNVEHKEPELDSYISISIPQKQYKLIIRDGEQPEPNPFKDVAFLYEKKGKFILQRFGQPLKELSTEQWRELQRYIEVLKET